MEQRSKALSFMSGSDFDQFGAAIARIYNQNGVVGCGVLIADGYLLTCAHVVAAALGVSSMSDNKPDGCLELDFPLDAANRGEIAEKLKAEVLVWFPQGIPSSSEDITILKLRDQASPTIQPVQMQPSPSFQERHRLTVYGFPGGDAKGRWADVVSMGVLDNGWIQVNSQTEGYAIEPGYSGTPVWDHDMQRVVGIMVARDRLGSLDTRGQNRSPARVAFFMPKKSLEPALQALDREKLLAFLESHLEQLQAAIQWAYQACCPDGWKKTVSHQLQSILADLQKMSHGDTGYSAIGRFVACLTVHLTVHPVAPSVVRQKLQSWLNASEDDQNGLQAWAQQQFDEWQEQQSVAVQSCLMVRIKPDPQKTDFYHVEAWFIHNVKFYSALTSEKSEKLSAPNQGEKSIRLEQIPELIRHFLDQIDRYEIANKDLTLDVFLPQNCLNHAVEHWLPPDPYGFPVPLGSEYPITVRSNERLSNYSYKGQWKAKWDEVRQLQGAALLGFKELSRNSNLKQMVQELGRSRMIGLKMPAPPREGSGRELALILRTGIPIALWVRQDLTIDCSTELDQLLGCCIHDLPHEVRNKRVNAFTQQEEVQNTEDDPLGHHLSLLWEDFDRVPPQITYSDAQL